MKKIGVFSGLALGTLLVIPVSVHANEPSHDEKVEDAKKFFSEHYEDLQGIFESIESASTVEEIQEYLEPYYDEIEIPESIEKEEIIPEEVFEKLETPDSNEVFTLNDEFNNNNNESRLDSVTYSFTDEGNFSASESSNSDKTIDVLLYESGEIIYLENEVIDSDEEFSAQATTRRERTTGHVQSWSGNMLLASMWAEGQFSYNGSTVNATLNDGNITRHVAGSAMVIDPRGVGSTRNYSEQGYNYAEVYTRGFFASTVGFRWAGIQVSASTLEVIQGSTANGNLYGQLVHPNR